MAAFFVPTRFTWKFGGSVVHLCGSFTRWVETVPMAPVEGSNDIFTVIVHLPPGYHQYKFIVDGEWRHDESQPYMPDPLGNVNNWLFVRRMEQQPQHAQGPQPSSQHLHPLLQVPPGQPPQTGSTPSLPHMHSQPSTGMSQQSGQLPDQSMPGFSQPQASTQSDVEMATASSVDSAHSPITAQIEEPQYTRRRVREFLNSHTCYELIPESGKVVLLDIDLPVRQAFHALHEQGVASAPLWDSDQIAVVGMISASDFINVLRRLRSSISSGANPMSEAEMDAHTIRNMRDQSVADGQPPKTLVSLNPTDPLKAVIDKLFQNRCSMAPVLTWDAHGHNLAGGHSEGRVNTLLHIATISGVLATLMRHFRASLSSLPLLGQAISNLPIGTWSPDAELPALDGSFAEGEERRDSRKLRPLHYVQPSTPLTAALSLLLEVGVSVLPVIDENGCLLDMYARSDITALAKGNSYSRLQWEEVTVGQALALAQQPAQSSHPSSSQGPVSDDNGNAARLHTQRVHLCTAQDSLRSVVERLSVPGVRRLFIVDRDTRKVWGILSLSDVAAFLFDAI